MAAEIRATTDDDDVQAILRAHPEIESFIERVTQVSGTFYPGAEVALHGARFEDDPPLVLTVKVVEQVSDFAESTNRFAQWLARQKDYDFSVISVAPLPSWTGPS